MQVLESKLGVKHLTVSEYLTTLKSVWGRGGREKANVFTVDFQDNLIESV